MNGSAIVTNGHVELQCKVTHKKSRSWKMVLRAILFGHKSEVHGPGRLAVSSQIKPHYFCHSGKPSRLCCFENDTKDYLKSCLSSQSVQIETHLCKTDWNHI